MRCFRVFSTYLILTVFNRHASRLLIIRLSYDQPQLILLYQIYNNKQDRPRREAFFGFDVVNLTTL